MKIKEMCIEVLKNVLEGCIGGIGITLGVIVVIKLYSWIFG